MTDFVDPRNANRPGGDPYNEVIRKISELGECPFCPDNLANHHQPPILHETDNWVLTDNMYRYKNAAEHLLLIHREHIETVEEVQPSAWSELQEVIGFANKLREIKGGALLMRFGETALTGASVVHLHAHIISGPGITPDSQPVWARVG